MKRRIKRQFNFVNMGSGINWKPNVNKLTKLSLEIYKDQEFTRDVLIQKLSLIFTDFRLIENTDNRTIAFLEFCFYMADGPYSRKFTFFVLVLRKVFAVYPPLRKLINKTGDAAIANMTLGAIGALKFEISDLYELKRVLWAWEKMGLRRSTISSVFYVVKNKYKVKRAISRKSLFILARLKAIFPMYQKSFLPSYFPTKSHHHHHHNTGRFHDNPASRLFLNQGYSLEFPEVHHKYYYGVPDNRGRDK